jgi:hypothetical protein
MKLNQLSVATAIALVAMTGVASADFMGTGNAAGCLTCMITVSGTNTTFTEPPLPAGFTPLNLGTSPGTPNSFISNAPIGPIAGSGITAITFLGGMANGTDAAHPSGLYAGNIANIVASPFGSGDSATNYLVAQPNGTAGGVSITYGSMQNTFDLIWGSVDSLNNENLLGLTIAASTDQITGMDIAKIITTAGGSFTQGALNVVVQITFPTSFSTLTAQDQSTNSAFEFDPLVVPAPLIGHGLLVLLAVGGVLFGGKLLENMKKRDLHVA